MVRLALSKPNFGTKLKYLLLGVLYYRALLREDHHRGSKNNDPDGDFAGDDVYPLF
jgi:hypothetical protein